MAKIPFDGFIVKSDDMNLVFAALDTTDYTVEHRLYVLVCACVGLTKIIKGDRAELIDAVRKNWNTIPAPDLIQEN